MPRNIRHYAVQKVVTRHLQQAVEQIKAGGPIDRIERWQEERDVFELLAHLLKHADGSTWNSLMISLFPELTETQAERMFREQTPEEIAAKSEAKWGKPKDKLDTFEADLAGEPDPVVRNKGGRPKKLVEA